MRGAYLRVDWTAGQVHSQVPRRRLKQGLDIGNNTPLSFVRERTCVPVNWIVYVSYCEIVIISLGGSSPGVGIVRLHKLPLLPHV